MKITCLNSSIKVKDCRDFLFGLLDMYVQKPAKLEQIKSAVDSLIEEVQFEQMFKLMEKSSER